MIKQHVAILLTLSMVTWSGCEQSTGPPAPAMPQQPPTQIDLIKPVDRPVEVTGHNYIASQNCKECHQHEYETWYNSYHRTMTQIAAPDAVLGAFDGFEGDFDGKHYQFTQHDGKYFVTASFNDQTDKRQVMLTTGSHHLQAYWVTTGETRTLYPVPFTWLIHEKRWVPNASTFLSPPNIQTENQLGRWNRNCLKCHATLAQPRITGEMKMDTRVVEFGIACEACHGPGEQHAEDELTNSIIQPQLLSHEKSAMVCGQCHSINVFHDRDAANSFNQQGASFRPGEDLTPHSHILSGRQDSDHPRDVQMRNRFPTLLKEMFWPDGMPRITGREYNGLRETPCYQRGEMDCLSCHQLHPPRSDHRDVKTWAADQLQADMYGNQACLQCHKDFAQEIESHTHHVAESSGSLCYNCHMPYTTYGLLGAIRSHMITSPTLKESIEYGRPNACNQCHLDKTLKWTGKHLNNWYDQPAAMLSVDQQAVPASVLWLISGDAGQRALSTWAYGWKEAQEASQADWIAPYLIHLLSDPYDAIRFMAYQSLQTLPGYEQAVYDYVADEKQREAAIKVIEEKTSVSQQVMDLISQLSANRDDRPILLQE